MTATKRAPIATRSLRETFPRIVGNPQLRGRRLRELEDALERTREFCNQYVRPRALELDRRAWADVDDFPWDLVREGGRYGLLTLGLPPQAGGQAQFMCTSLCVILEELSAACPGVSTIFGAHGLGVAPLQFGGPMFWDSVMREIADGERNGEPVLMAFAITEPSAGTDMENPELVDRAHLGCHARPVDGGFQLVGTKHFISNGAQARWITVFMPVDPARPRATMTCFLVDTRSVGFRVGHVEHKMGQRACRAAEIVFDDVFVPESRVVGRVGDGATNMMCVLIVSRPGVGAIGTGIARGAYDRLLDWLLNDPDGKQLLERQEVQLALAQMEEEIHVSRQAYLDAATEFDVVTIGGLMQDPGVKLLSRAPRGLRDNALTRRGLRSGLARGAVMKMMERRIGNDGLTRALALSSMAKARGADTAMNVTGRALEIAGLSSGPLRAELEKLMRDAKLVQIFEGTNQLNRLEVYEGLSVAGELGLLPIGAGDWRGQQRPAPVPASAPADDRPITGALASRLLAGW